MRPIQNVAAALGIASDQITPWGDAKAKVSLGALDRRRDEGRLVLVSAMTPTPAGEGKTTTAIGLAQGLAATGRRVCVVLREPSLGPTFGRKGGATGGGRSVLVPADDINLHFTGDFHAIGAAHNLLAAMLDNHLHHGNRLDIDPQRVMWRRVIDINDRALRQIAIGLGPAVNGVTRQSGFDITAASEVMAALCLAEGYDDLRDRLGRIVVALTGDTGPVTAADLNAVGAMMVLLKDALRPNLVQTGEGVPALVHGGPFANIAHGCNSVVATKLALRHADWVVTEAGFGFELGGEKFLDLMCVAAELDPAVVMLVSTIRALKLHGGVEPSALTQPDADAVSRGLANLHKQIDNVERFGKRPVVALNRFESDRDDEIDRVRQLCVDRALPFDICDGYRRGGQGGVSLAETVVAQATQPGTRFTPLYAPSASAEEKLSAIATTMYGAGSVVWSREAQHDLDIARACGCVELPLCVAKTHASLSDNPSRKGRPEGFTVTVGRLFLAPGAGYLVPALGEIRRMPGLPSVPQAEHMDLVDGRVVGVSS